MSPEANPQKVEFATELRMHQLLGQVTVSEEVRTSLEASLAALSGEQQSVFNALNTICEATTQAFTENGHPLDDEVLNARIPSIIKASVTKADRTSVQRSWKRAALIPNVLSTRQTR